MLTGHAGNEEFMQTRLSRERFAAQGLSWRRRLLHRAGIQRATEENKREQNWTPNAQGTARSVTLIDLFSQRPIITSADY